MKDIPNLDFVRSVAVISVVVSHLLLALHIMQAGPFPTAPLGVLGVMLFFVLTSLVLMWSLERRPHTLDFYIRRWFRIYPLAWVVLAVALLFHAPTGGTPQSIFLFTALDRKDIVNQFSLLPIFAANAPVLVGPMWSLPYEIMMYLLLPILYFFVRKNFSLWPLLLAWALILLNTRRTPNHNFGTAIGYFLPGVMAYVAFGRWKPVLPGWTLPLFLLVLWAVFIPHFSFHGMWEFCLIVGLGLPLFRQIDQEWILAPSRQIAKYSYGIYLTHMFGLVVGIRLLSAHSLPVQVLAVVLSTAVLSLLGYHLIEHPMIRLGSRLASRAESRYEQHEMKQLRELPSTVNP